MPNKKRVYSSDSDGELDKKRRKLRKKLENLERKRRHKHKILSKH